MFNETTQYINHLLYKREIRILWYIWNFSWNFTLYQFWIFVRDQNNWNDEVHSHAEGSVSKEFEGIGSRHGENNLL